MTWDLHKTMSGDHVPCRAPSPRESLVYWGQPSAPCFLQKAVLVTLLKPTGKLMVSSLLGAKHLQRGAEFDPRGEELLAPSDSFKITRSVAASERCTPMNQAPTASSLTTFITAILFQ